MKYTRNDIYVHVSKMKALYARDLKDRILVHINNPSVASPVEHFPDIEQMFQSEMRNHDVRKTFVDDFFPSAQPPCMGRAIHSFLGAEFKYTKQNVWNEPIPGLYEKLESIKYDATNRWLTTFLGFMEYYKTHLPSDCVLSSPSIYGPDDIADGLRGTELFYDIIDRPDQVKALFKACAEFIIQFRPRLLAIVDHIDGGYVSWQGYWVPDNCYTLTDDMATNYSPQVYEEFTIPAIRSVVDAVGGFFDMHLEGSAVHILDRVKKINGLLLLQYTNNPKWPRGIAMMDRLRTQMGDLPLKLLLSKQEFLEGMKQRILTGNCIYDVGVDTENWTDKIETPEEAEEIMIKAGEYRARM